MGFTRIQRVWALLTIGFIFSTNLLAQIPTITSFTPTTQSFGGTVTITGTNFTAASVVKFGVTDASSVTFVSATSLQAVVRCGTTGSITVTTSGGTATRTGFTFNSTPTAVAQPAAFINARTNVAGFTTATYVTRKTTNATSYEWSIGTGSPNSISSNPGLGANDTTATVTFRTSPPFCSTDTVSVRAKNTCSTSTARTQVLITSGIPPTPSSVVNSNPLVCAGQTTTITVNAANSGLSQPQTSTFRWTKLPNFTSITSANTDSSVIQLTLNGAFASSTNLGGIIVANAVSTCGSMNATGTNVNITNVPTAISSIRNYTNSLNACDGTENQFTLVAGAATSSSRATNRFRWTLPSSFYTITSSNSDSSIVRIKFNTGFSSATIKVSPVTTCGVAANGSNIAIVKKTCPLDPGPITGPTSLCSFYNPATRLTDTLTYSTTPVVGALKYAWLLPLGSRVVRGDSTNEIGVVFDSSITSFYGQGRIYVGTMNSDRVVSNNFSELRVFVNRPFSPGSVTGLTDVCRFINKDSLITYTVPTNSLITSYVWTVSPGISLLSGQGSNSIQVKFNDSMSFYSLISVFGISNCGTTNIVPKSINKSGSSPAPSSIRNSFSPLLPVQTNVAGLTSTTLRVLKVRNAVSYNWTLSQGTHATITHLNSPGPNDTAIEVNFLSGFLFDTVNVSSQTQCNISLKRSVRLSATANPPPVNGITGERSPCRNNTFTYLASHLTPSSAQAPVNRFRWIIPPNSSIVSSNSDSSIIQLFYNGAFTTNFLRVRTVSDVGIVSLSVFSATIRMGTPCNNPRMENVNQNKIINNPEVSLQPEIFPNPSSTDFLFAIPTNDKLDPNSQLIITDVTGKIVEIVRIPFSGKIRFGTTFLPGIYFLNFSNRDRKYIKKIVKK